MIINYTHSIFALRLMDVKNNTFATTFSCRGVTLREAPVSNG